MIESIVYITGFTVILAVLCLINLVLAWVFFKLASYQLRQLLRIVRYTAINYYVNRMEKEGLTAVQTEYRKMVEDRKTYLFKDFAKLDREINYKERNTNE